MLILSRRVVAISLALMLALAACGNEPGDSVAGRTFLSTSSNGFELVDGSVIRLTFDDHALSGSAGCNSFSGEYTIDGGILQIESLAMTEMACDEPLMDQDSRIAELLTGGPRLALNGNELTLTSGDATLTLLDREVADPDRPLEGTRWTVSTVISGDSASHGWGTAVATLTIIDDLAIVDTGCNTGTGPVTITGDTIDFGPLDVTQIGCSGPAIDLELAVLATLSGTVTFEIEAATLTLMNGPHGLQLTAES